MAHKTPVKNNPNINKQAVSLTDEQYEAIFNSAIYTDNALQFKSPVIADTPGNTANSPSQSASVDSSEPEVYNMNISFESDNIKCTDLWSEELTEDEISSGPPKFTSRRERLLWLQEQRGTGLYVKCDNATCGKWRWLTNPDPEDLPPQWFCFMHPDKRLASCNAPEKPIPSYVEDDLIQNCFTPGSIVWAKLTGYPWWPAMVDDCPDCEMYYWINKEGDIVPDWYHVVFLDNGASEKVSRRWLIVKNVKSFKRNPNFGDKNKVKQIYKRRIIAAKQMANTALLLSIKERLKKYSFLALWDKEIPEYTSSDESDVDESNWDEEKILKKKIRERKKSNYNRRKELKRRSSSSTIADNETLSLRVNNSENAENNKSVPSKKQNPSSNVKSINATITTCKDLTDSENNVIKIEQNADITHILAVPKNGSNNNTSTAKSLQEKNVVNETIKDVDREIDLMREAYYRCYAMYTSGEMGQVRFEQLYNEIICNTNKNKVNSEKHSETKSEKEQPKVIHPITPEIKLNNNDSCVTSLTAEEMRKIKKADSSLELLSKNVEVKSLQKIVMSEKKSQDETKLMITEIQKLKYNLSNNDSVDKKISKADSTLKLAIQKLNVNEIKTQETKVANTKTPDIKQNLNNMDDRCLTSLTADKKRKISEADSTLEHFTKKLTRSFKIPLRSNK